MPSSETCDKKYIKISHSCEKFPGQIGVPYLGWWYVDKHGRWEPAEKLKIYNHDRIAIFLFGFSGGLSEIGQFFQGLNKYSKILAIRYNTATSVKEDSGPFVYKLLYDLLCLDKLQVDIFAYSLGSIIIRYNMEILQLGKYTQFQNIITIANPVQGLLTDNSKFKDPDGALASKISNGIIVLLLQEDLGFSVEKLLETDIYQFQANSQFDTLLPGASPFMNLLNNKKITEPVYKNLKYYVLNGYSHNLLPICDLQELFHTPNPYVYVAHKIYHITDQDEKLIRWEKEFPAQGLLGYFALELADKPKQVIFDSFVPTANSILELKSKFFRDNKPAVELFVPRNHSNIMDLDKYMEIVYADLVNRLKHDKFCE